MADNDNNSIPKEEQENKESPTPMDTNSDEKLQNDEESKELEQEKDTKEEKNDAEGEDEDDSEDDEEEELPPGLLEQPLEMQGKREKRKVERLSVATVPHSAEKKKVEIEEGSGKKLVEIAFIENKLNVTKAADLKPLHRLLFHRIGTANEVKKNIRQFCGFTQPKESKEYERRVAMLTKMHLPELKSICVILGLERSGTKKDVIDRIMDFLMSPDDKGMKVPKSKKAKRKSKSSDGKKETKKGVKRKRAPKKTTKKAKSDEVVDDEDEDDAGGSLDDDDDEEEEVEEEQDVSDQEEDEEESEEEAPKKKKAKAEPKKEPKKETKKKASEKVNGKKEKPPTKKEPKKPSPKKKKEVILEDELSDDSDSDDEPIANMKKSPPSNDEIKELVKKILDGADLESVTMKTVVKEVYSKYPTFDLSDRKDFIKNTVREVIS